MKLIVPLTATGTPKSKNLRSYTSKNGTHGIDRKVVADYIEFANFGKRSQETEEGVTRQNATTTQDVAATVTTGGLKKKTVEPKVEVTQDQDDDLPF